VEVSTDHGPGPDLEELYDERTLAAIDGRSGAIPTVRETWTPVARRRGLAASMLTGMALALREVYDPPPDDDIVSSAPTAAIHRTRTG
jgi:hypothetical protein